MFHGARSVQVLTATENIKVFLAGTIPRSRERIMMAYKPGHYGVPRHVDTGSLADPVEQIRDTEEIIQIAAERAGKPEGAALAQLAQAQANLAIAAALTQINRTLQHAHETFKRVHEIR